MRAVELHGIAVADNRRAFAWGRAAAVDPQRAEQQAAAAEVLPSSRQLSRTLDEAIERRRAELVAYQGEALAARYLALVGRVRQAEQKVAPGSERLARAVATQAFHLFAYKDEYEVARLHGGAAFDAALAAAFEDGGRVHLHLAPPWQRRGGDGQPRKQRYGPWMRGALRLLARARGLRGTPFDPFGWSSERRLERSLAAQYEGVVDTLLAQLSAARLDAAVALAEWPAAIRGFGPVKRRQAEAARARLPALVAACAAGPAAAATAAAPPAAAQ
jgi:indolepyruvate ferredoxin oxidoreductase